MTSQAGRSLTGAAGLLLVALMAGCATSSAPAGSPAVGRAGSPAISPAPSPPTPADLEFGLGDAPTVRRGAGVVVAVEQGGPTPQAGRLLRLAQRAVQQVDAIVPTVRRRLVVLVPASEPDMEAILGAAGGAYSDTAAVSTTSPHVSGLGDRPRVYLNPAQFERYNHQGQLILLTHEATHVLTGVVDNTAMPLWLVEGFADDVALRDVRLPLTTTAKQILLRVRRLGPPAHLPASADFAKSQASDAAFGAEYEASWLACRLIADRSGQAQLVALYEAVKRGQPIQDALPRYAGLGLPAFTRLWQRRLSEWSHPGPR